MASKIFQIMLEIWLKSEVFCTAKKSIRHYNMLLCYLGPDHTGTQSFHFVLYCSEKWNAEGLRSDENVSNRTVPFQIMEQLKK